MGKDTFSFELTEGGIVPEGAQITSEKDGNNGKGVGYGFKYLKELLA